MFSLKKHFSSLYLVPTPTSDNPKEYQHTLQQLKLKKFKAIFKNIEKLLSLGAVLGAWLLAAPCFNCLVNAFCQHMQRFLWSHWPIDIMFRRKHQKIWPTLKLASNRQEMNCSPCKEISQISNAKQIYHKN